MCCPAGLSSLSIVRDTSEAVSDVRCVYIDGFRRQCCGRFTTANFLITIRKQNVQMCETSVAGVPYHARSRYDSVIVELFGNSFKRLVSTSSDHTIDPWFELDYCNDAHSRLAHIFHTTRVFYFLRVFFAVYIIEVVNWWVRICEILRGKYLRCETYLWFFWWWSRLFLLAVRRNVLWRSILWPITSLMYPKSGSDCLQECFSYDFSLLGGERILL